MGIITGRQALAQAKRNPYLPLYKRARNGQVGRIAVEDVHPDDVPGLVVYAGDVEEYNRRAESEESKLRRYFAHSTNVAVKAAGQGPNNKAAGRALSHCIAE